MKNRKRTVTMAAVVLAFVMAFAVAMPVVANATAQDDYNAAQAELDKIEKELNSIKSTIKKQEKEKANAQTQVNLVKKQLASLTEQIEQTSEELTQKQLELDEKKVAIYETDELFKSRLKAMYIQRNGNMVATVLAVNTFSEMLTAANTLQSISAADTALLQKLNEEKAEIERVEAEIQQKLDDLNASREAQQAKQTELAALLKKVNSQLSQSEAQEAAAQEAYKEAKAVRDAAAAELEAEYKQNGGLDGYVGGTWKWPVPTNRYVSSHYGYRNIFGYREFHTGIDIPAPERTPIIASNSGVVTTARYASTGYGNRVIVDHGGGYKTLYAHCYSLNVKVGDYVTQGDVIAYVGSTGMSTGNHLHFEIRENDVTVNPYPYIKDN
ncbi:MAG: peptidoglycan DD-metalloendopeptidase family protein [Oscillospiraceae bacterium]|nr:peptidoglycan DD-metalloendopeptidase family protein [Oscillospiraceae bacterium]